jgi:oligosaccharide repeat unit polymerase
MIIAIIILAGISTVLLGRWMFGRWFNHVGLYGAIWSFSLALFQVGLIYYYPLEMETWFIIITGWLAFVMGSGTVVCARFAMDSNAVEVSRMNKTTSEVAPSSVLRVLWIINIITVIYSIYTVYNISRLLGSVSNIFIMGNLLYQVRVHEEIPGAIPYVGTLTLVGSLLAGYYTSMVGRLRFATFVAIFTAITSSIANMTRATLIITGILFVTGYLVNREKKTRQYNVRYSSKFRSAFTFILIVALIVTGLEIIRGNRGMTESFTGQTKTLKKLSVGAGSFITPSIVMYITAHHGVLNQYLRHEGENHPVGHYSLAPLWRVLSKFGYDTYVEQHSSFYNTPVPANTGSYLRELHADYGMAGIVVCPFLLGLISSIYWFRFKRTQALWDLVILGHIYVIVGMSLFTFATGTGVLWASLSLGLFIVSVFFPRQRKISNMEILKPDNYL